MSPVARSTDLASWRRIWLRALATLLAVCVFTACTGDPDRPRSGPAGADELATKLASALQAGDLTGLPFAGDSSAAIADYEQATQTMRGTLPESVSAEVVPHGKQALAKLNQSYDFQTGKWAFTSTADLAYDEQAKAWQIVWAPTIIHPALTPQTRLVHDRTAARRGNIVDRNGKAIVEYRPVYEVGIDKTKIPPEQADASARALATLLKIDVDGYATQVNASGPQAFVLAITLRAGEVPDQIDTIPGAVALGTNLPLAPTASFARNLLGTVAQASAEDIEKSAGTIKAGDLVGQFGIQRSQDAVLRGTPGHTVTLNYRPGAKPSSSGTPQPSAANSPANQATPATIPATLFSVAPVNGKALKLTLDMDLQAKLEDEMTRRSGTVTATVLDVNTGGILASAQSGNQGGLPLSTAGRYSPGSTFKVVSALAYLRRGLTPDSPVDCSTTSNVGGREFGNYPGYPAAKTGLIPLREALVESCNTSFVNAKFSGEEIASAAASLGVGADYDVGFDAFFGSVPLSTDPIVRAANSFGQGEILMSTLASAGMSASVAAGRTVVPHLIMTEQPTPKGQSLTSSEAAALRDMMGAVAVRGTGIRYQQWLKGTKTGTAEYAADGAVRSHIWVTGFTDDRAIAIIDVDNETQEQFFPIFEATLK